MNDIVTTEISSLPSLLGASLGDTGKEFAEVAIDSVLNDGVLKDIPIVGVIAGFCKFGISIREKNLLKQTLEFINAFNSGTISPERLTKYKNEIETNPKKAEEELGRCLIIMNSTIEKEQSKLLGRLYNSYVKGSISWSKFVELSDASHRLFVEDIRILKEIDRRQEARVAVNDENAYKYYRLQSIGLLSSSNGVVNIENQDESELDLSSNVFTISQFGMIFINNSGLRDFEIT